MSAFKLFGSAAQRFFPKSEFAHQGAAFFGLLGAHRVEEALALRDSVSDPTRITDALSALFAMGVGAHLGRRALGPGFAGWQRELQLRSQHSEGGAKPNFSSLGETWGGTPALSQVGPSGLLLPRPTARLWETQISLSTGGNQIPRDALTYRENVTPEMKLNRLLEAILPSSDQTLVDPLERSELLTEYLRELTLLPDDSPLFPGALGNLIARTGFPEFSVLPNENALLGWEVQELKLRSQILSKTRTLLEGRPLQTDQQEMIRAAALLAQQNSKPELLYQLQKMYPIVGFRRGIETVENPSLETLVELKLHHLKEIYTTMGGKLGDWRKSIEETVRQESFPLLAQARKNMLIGAGVFVPGIAAIALLHLLALPAWPAFPWIAMGILLGTRGFLLSQKRSDIFHALEILKRRGEAPGEAVLPPPTKKKLPPPGSGWTNLLPLLFLSSGLSTFLQPYTADAATHAAPPNVGAIQISAALKPGWSEALLSLTSLFLAMAAKKKSSGTDGGIAPMDPARQARVKELLSYPLAANFEDLAWIEEELQTLGEDPPRFAQALKVLHRINMLVWHPEPKFTRKAWEIFTSFAQTVDLSRLQVLDQLFAKESRAGRKPIYGFMLLDAVSKDYPGTEISAYATVVTDRMIIDSLRYAAPFIATLKTMPPKEVWALLEDALLIGDIGGIKQMGLLPNEWVILRNEPAESLSVTG